MTFAKSLAINAVQEQAQQKNPVQSHVCRKASTALANFASFPKPRRESGKRAVQVTL